MQFMNKTKVIIASVFTALSIGIITATFVSATPKSIETPIVSQTSEAVTVSKPIEQQEVVNTVTEPTIEQKPVVEPVNVSEAPQIQSNEDLIVQYGWANGAYRDSINYLINSFPHKFTDEMRKSSFEYLNEASIRFAAANNQDGNSGITYAYIMTRNGRTTEEDWQRIMMNSSKPFNS